MNQQSVSWRRLFRQAVVCPLALAWANAGKSRDARMAIMAITTRSSIRVKAWPGFRGHKPETFGAMGSVRLGTMGRERIERSSDFELGGMLWRFISLCFKSERAGSQYSRPRSGG